MTMISISANCLWNTATAVSLVPSLKVYTACSPLKQILECYTSPPAQLGFRIVASGLIFTHLLSIKLMGSSMI